MRRFPVVLGDTRQDRQVEQAKDAIRLYRYYQDNAQATLSTRTAGTDKLWADAVDQMIVSMRLTRLAHRTEQIYVTVGCESFTVM